jgi:hypothetical protein
MSTGFQALKLKLERERVPVHYVSPFESFARMQGLSVHDSQKLLLFVRRAGGGLETDLSTLSALFEVWKGKGRP